MSQIELKKAGQARTGDLQTLAAQGVQRALAVRMTELSAEQAQQVGAGAAISVVDDYCGNGIRPIPKLGGGGALGGDIVIINGQFPRVTLGF
jgi:hypothetical protein